MREILFRGFSPFENGREIITVNGKQIKGMWVQGSYWELHETTYCFKSDYDRHPDNTKHYILFDKMTDWGLPNKHLQADVIPETVGQYTGLCDKNGKKIFEGDVCEIGNYIYMVEFKYSMWYFTILSNKVYCCPAFSSHCGEYCEVIGNIHDNPELLEVANG